MTQFNDSMAFSEWLLRYGASAGTVEMYCRNVKLAFNHPQGWAGRVMQRDLAPKTRRGILASLKSYAKFRQDESFILELKKIKLPPPLRKTPREPMSDDDWTKLVEAIETCDETPAMRAVLGMMAVRGFRVGDLMRLEHVEVDQGIAKGVMTFGSKGTGGGGKRLTYSTKPYMKYLDLLASQLNWTIVADLIAPSAQPARRQRSATVAVERALRRVAESAGLKATTIYPHRLRRTVATMFLRKAKGDVVQLCKWFGWADLKTAYEYLDDINRDELDKVWESEDITDE